MIEHTEEQAYNILNRNIKNIDERVKKTNSNNNEYSILSLLVISQLLGFWNKDNVCDNPVYFEVRNNWDIYERLGCTKEKCKYKMSFRGILNLLIHFGYLDKEGKVKEKEKEMKTEDIFFSYFFLIKQKSNELKEEIDYVSEEILWKKDIRNKMLELEKQYSNIENEAKILLEKCKNA